MIAFFIAVIFSCQGDKCAFYYQQTQFLTMEKCQQSLETHLFVMRSSKPEGPVKGACLTFKKYEA